MGEIGEGETRFANCRRVRETRAEIGPCSLASLGPRAYKVALCVPVLSLSSLGCLCVPSTLSSQSLPSPASTFVAVAHPPSPRHTRTARLPPPSTFFGPTCRSPVTRSSIHHAVPNPEIRLLGILVQVYPSCSAYRSPEPCVLPFVTTASKEYRRLVATSLHARTAQRREPGKGNLASPYHRALVVIMYYTLVAKSPVEIGCKCLPSSCICCSSRA